MHHILSNVVRSMESEACWFVQWCSLAHTQHSAMVRVTAEIDSIGGVMVWVLASSVGDCVFELRSCQIKVWQRLTDKQN